MWVFKVGGSLAQARELPLWLKGLAREGAGRAVIVPGGGPFANTVREMQSLWRFPDRVAHGMALLAMANYGLMMCGLEPGLRPARHREEVASALSSGRVPVWLPFDGHALEAIPKGWEVSSDSLAAWLAGALGAQHLCLVKSVSPTSNSCTATALAARGVVDQAFPRFHEGLQGCSWWLGREHYRHIGELLMGATGGCRIAQAGQTPRRAPDHGSGGGSEAG